MGLGMRRDPGMCCECGKPECDIGPFTRRCGEGPSYGGPSSYARQRIEYERQRLRYELDYQREKMRGIRGADSPPAGYEIGEWRKLGEEYRAETMMRVEHWESMRTGERFLRALSDYDRYWEPPNFPPNRAPVRAAPTQYWMDESADIQAPFLEYAPKPFIPKPRKAPAPVPEPPKAAEPTALSSADTASLEAALAAYEASLVADKV